MLGAAKCLHGSDLVAVLEFSVAVGVKLLLGQAVQVKLSLRHAKLSLRHAKVAAPEFLVKSQAAPAHFLVKSILLLPLLGGLLCSPGGPGFLVAGKLLAELVVLLLLAELLIPCLLYTSPSPRD